MVFQCPARVNRGYSSLNGVTSTVCGKRQEPPDGVKAKAMDPEVQAILQSTNMFCPELLVSSTLNVYRGRYKKQPVAVRRVAWPRESEGAERLQEEVTELPKIRHHNVVPCIAHHATPTHCLIVYQFPEGRTLREALAAPWHWAPRLRAVSDVSRGLLHLHGLSPPVAHCGVWASNVFVVGDKAQLGWYGAPVGAAADAMEPGYRDPEASNTLQTTLSTDVYCLGIVMLEALTGRPALESGRAGTLRGWVLEAVCKASQATSVCDATAEWPPALAQRWLDLAIACSHEFSRWRPETRMIPQALGRWRAIQDWDAIDERWAPPTLPGSPAPPPPHMNGRSAAEARGGAARQPGDAVSTGLPDGWDQAAPQQEQPEEVEVEGAEVPACGALDVWRDHLALLEGLQGSDEPLVLPQWEARNEAVGQCRECRGVFGWLKWRHNCGACGAVVCRGCTQSWDTATLPGRLRQHFGLGTTCRVCRRCDVRSKARPAPDSAAHHLFACPYRCQSRLLFKRDLLTHLRQSCPLAPLRCYNKCGALTCRQQMHEHFEVCELHRVPCPDGCGATIARRDLSAHSAGCQYKKVACDAPDCPEVVLRKDLEQHLRRYCQFTLVKCENGCGQALLRGMLKQHEEGCPTKQIKCTHPKCGLRMERQAMEAHDQVCGYKIVECPAPGCPEQVRRKDLDKHVERDCAHTLVSCPKKCGWKGKRQEAALHLRQDCPLEEVECPNEGCGKHMLRQDTAEHDKRCRYKTVSCSTPDCPEQLLRRDLKHHLEETCKFVEVPCPQNCGATMERQRVERHVAEGCPETTVDCPGGCGFKAPRKDLPAHSATCENVTVECDAGCGQSMLRSELSQHKAKQCPEAELPCHAGCGAMIKRKLQQEHRDLCPEVVVHCEFCRKRMKRRELGAHEAEECPAAPVERPNEGCQEGGPCGGIDQRLQNWPRAKTDQHTQECSRSLSQCDLCGQKMMRRRLQHHMEQQCPKRQVRCPVCGSYEQWDNMAEHMTQHGVPKNMFNRQMFMRMAAQSEKQDKGAHAHGLGCAHGHAKGHGGYNSNKLPPRGRAGDAAPSGPPPRPLRGGPPVGMRAGGVAPSGSGKGKGKGKAGTRLQNWVGANQPLGMPEKRPERPPKPPKPVQIGRRQPQTKNWPYLGRDGSTRNSKGT